MELSSIILEHLDALLKYLRRDKEYDIGIGEYNLIRELIIKLISENRLPDSLEGWTGLLAPVVCKTGQQQKNLRLNVQEWIENFRFSKTSFLDPEDPSPEVLLKEVEKTTAFRRVGVFLILLVVLIATSLLIRNWPSGEKTENDQTNQENNQNNEISAVDFEVYFILLGSFTFLFFSVFLINKKIEKLKINAFLRRLKITPSERFLINKLFYPDFSKNIFQVNSLFSIAKKFNNSKFVELNKIDIKKTIRRNVTNGGDPKFEKKWISIPVAI